MTFKTSGQRLIHSRKHTNEKPYQCSKCPMAFSSRGNFTKHFKVIHEKPKTREFECSICRKTFETLGTLKCHEKRHSDDRSKKCLTCGIGFVTPGELKIHQRTHSGEKPYQCKTCFQSFTQRGQLKVHSRLHSADRPLPCKEKGCTFAFNRKADLLKHIKNTHKNQWNNLEMPLKSSCTGCLKNELEMASNSV